MEGEHGALDGPSEVTMAELMESAEEAKKRRSLQREIRRDRGPQRGQEPDTEGLEEIGGEGGDSGDTGGYTNVLDEDGGGEQQPGRSQQQPPSQSTTGKGEHEHAREAREDKEQQKQHDAVESQQGGEQSAGQEEQGAATTADSRRQQPGPEEAKRTAELEKAAAEGGEIEKKASLRESVLQSMQKARQLQQIAQQRTQAFIRNIILNNPWVRGVLIGFAAIVVGTLAMFMVNIILMSVICDIDWMPDVTKNLLAEWRVGMECPNIPKVTK